MARREFLELNNPYQLVRCLDHVLTTIELAKVRSEHHSHVVKLLTLSKSHMTFARAVMNRRHWRQIISRCYYGAYNASRAIRFGVLGHYSTESKDHKDAGDLPDDFPDRGKWRDFFAKLRGDRNTADYDHLATIRSLENGLQFYLSETQTFVSIATKYLSSKGVLK